MVFTLYVGVPGCEKFTIKRSLHIFVSLHSTKALLLQRWTCKLFFTVSQQIPNLQILRLIPQPPNRKFLRSASPQVENAQYFYGLRKLRVRKKIWSANRKSANCHTCRRFANLTNLVGPQVWGFAICCTYLRTAHHCNVVNVTPKL